MTLEEAQYALLQRDEQLRKALQELSEERQQSANLCDEAAKLRTENGRLREDIYRHEKWVPEEVAKLQAQCAAMREVLNLCGQKFMFLTGEVEYESAEEEKRAHDAIGKVYPEILKALSTDAGTELLATLGRQEKELKDAEELLSVGFIGRADWWERRVNAFLARQKGAAS